MALLSQSEPISIILMLYVSFFYSTEHRKHNCIICPSSKNGAFVASWVCCILLDVIIQLGRLNPLNWKVLTHATLNVYLGTYLCIVDAFKTPLTFISLKSSKIELSIHNYFTYFDHWNKPLAVLKTFQRRPNHFV